MLIGSFSVRVFCSVHRVSDVNTMLFKKSITGGYCCVVVVIVVVEYTHIYSRIKALQGHPWSLILAPIERAYATSRWSPTVTLVLSCPVSEIL